MKKFSPNSYNKNRYHNNYYDNNYNYGYDNDHYNSYQYNEVEAKQGFIQERQALPFPPLLIVFGFVAVVGVVLAVTGKKSIF